MAEIFINKSKKIVIERFYESLLVTNKEDYEQIISSIGSLTIVPESIKEEERIFNYIELQPTILCKELFKQIHNYSLTKSLWPNKFFFGFLFFLIDRGVCVDLNLVYRLFYNIFNEKEDIDLTIPDFNSIKQQILDCKDVDYDLNRLLVLASQNKNEIEEDFEYQFYSLPIYERDIKKFVEHFSFKELDLIFSIRLIWTIIEKYYILEAPNSKIIYADNDIPLLKRIIIAQIIKLNEFSCSDELIEQNFGILSQINIKCLDNNLTFNIEPWEEF
ncbi:hypothetical protein ES705_13365 [subsurface metagenome]